MLTAPCSRFRGALELRAMLNRKDMSTSCLSRNFSRILNTLFTLSRHTLLSCAPQPICSPHTHCVQTKTCTHHVTSSTKSENWHTLDLTEGGPNGECRLEASPLCPPWASRFKPPFVLQHRHVDCFRCMAIPLCALRSRITQPTQSRRSPPAPEPLELAGYRGGWMSGMVTGTKRTQ